VLGTRSLGRRESARRVLPQGRVADGHQAAMGEDPRVPRSGEERMRHASGRESADAEPGRGVKALPIPLSASVSSLGMIHSLLDELSLIFGSICRYWYARSLSSG